MDGKYYNFKIKSWKTEWTYIQWVILHSQDFSIITCAQQLVVLGSFWGLLNTISKTFQLLRMFPNSSAHVNKFSDDLQTLPKTFRDFMKI